MSKQDFILHPQLQQDSIVIAYFELSQVLLVNDKQYPWFILVPQRQNIKEIYELEIKDQQQLLHESSIFAKAIQTIFKADKLNIAALGNMVPQLHIHHIVRYTSDSAWPGPIWGVKPAVHYASHELESVITQLKQATIAGLQFTD